MKVLVATEKPFAPAAVEGIKEVITENGHQTVLLEKYTDVQQLLDAVADADEKAREQEHQRCGRANSAQRLRSRKLSDNRNIRHIEKHLKHV